MSDLEFTADWFDKHRQIWDVLLPPMQAKRILEIGSYEGASTCYLIDTCAKDADIELHCIDTWQGSAEHQHGGNDMKAVEDRFNRNVQRAISRASHKVDLTVHKGPSDEKLAGLLAGSKRNYFDFIYVDGSHLASDVLLDGALALRLLRVDGLIVFDDYLWFENLREGKDPLQCPKIAIDAVVNNNFRKVEVLTAPLYQLFLTKLSD